MVRLGVVLVCGLLFAFAHASVKPYPVPLFIWAESDSFLQAGRTWISRSTSTDDIRRYLVSITNPSNKNDQLLFPTSEPAISPEIVVLFLEPGMLFGRNEQYGGTRMSTQSSVLRKLKRFVEGSAASVVVPYSYDLDLELNEDDHTSKLIAEWTEMIENYLQNCDETCNLLVETTDKISAQVWEPFFLSNEKILDLSEQKTEEYLNLNSNIFFNKRTDLLIVHLSTDLSNTDSKIVSVLASISKYTKNYVSILTADDVYLPTYSTWDLRENPVKLEWVERSGGINDTENLVPTPSPILPPPPPPTPSEYQYQTRWPEFAWEFLLSFLLLFIIFSYGICCLVGLDTPRRFDNPKEKNL